MTTTEYSPGAGRSESRLWSLVLLIVAAGCGGTSPLPPQGQTAQEAASQPAADVVKPKASGEAAPATFGVNGDLIGVTTNQQFLEKYPTGYLTPTVREGVEQAEPYAKDASPASLELTADGIPVSYFAYEFVDGRLELIDATSRHPDAYERFLKAFTEKFGEAESTSPAPARSAQWKQENRTLILSELPEGAANFNFLDQNLAKTRRDRPKSSTGKIPSNTNF